MTHSLSLRRESPTSAFFSIGVRVIFTLTNLIPGRDNQRLTLITLISSARADEGL